MKDSKNIVRLVCVLVLLAMFPCCSVEGSENLPKVRLYSCCLTKSQREDLLYYLRRLDRHLRKHFKCPKVPGNPRTIVKFKLAQTGELLEIPTIEKRSDSSQYDSAILEAFQNSKPFPSPPENIGCVEITCLFGVFDILSKPPQIIEGKMSSSEKKK